VEAWFDSQEGQEVFLVAQTGSVAEPASYSVDTGGKAMPGWSGSLVSSDAEEYVELTSTPLYVFMAWRLIKYRNNLTLRLLWNRILLDHDIHTFYWNWRFIYVFVRSKSGTYCELV